MDRLQGKVAIITGAGTGMGEAEAILFAKEGAKVAVTDINESDGLKVVEKIKAFGGEAEFFKQDVSKEEECARVVAEVAQKWGKIDILVNNAGVTGGNTISADITEEEFNFVVGVDVKGTMWMTKHVVPYMKANKGGSIVDISSIGGLVAMPGLYSYQAAKGAVTMMAKADAIAYAPDHIRVNSVHPGLIMTPLTLKGEEMVPGHIARMTAKIPLGYMGEVEDIAYTVLFLASDESRFITGTQLVADGGYCAQ